MRSLTQLALSELLYPLHLVEGVFRTQAGVGRHGSRLYAALFGGLAAGAMALLLLRTLDVPSGIVVLIVAYGAGAAVAILARAIIEAIFSNNEDVA